MHQLIGKMRSHLVRFMQQSVRFRQLLFDRFAIGYIFNCSKVAYRLFIIIEKDYQLISQPSDLFIFSYNSIFAYLMVALLCEQHLQAHPLFIIRMDDCEPEEWIGHELFWTITCDPFYHWRIVLWDNYPIFNTGRVE